MKIISISFLVLSIFTFFSCDSDDARTPLGITISAPDFDILIEEDPNPDTVLGTLTATASDGSDIQFGKIVEEDSTNSKFESETPIGALDIDNQTGELTIKDVTAFNFDENTEINATINAISRNVTEAINITIFINPDRRVLTEILESNPDNTLGWELSETDDLNDLSGVTLTDGRVTSLDLSETELTTIPDSISNLSALTDLDLSNNSITTITDSVASLNNLLILNLSDNNLTTLPESFSGLVNLTSLDISDNNITEETLPNAICTAFDFDNDDMFIKDTEATCGDLGDNSEEETGDEEPGIEETDNEEPDTEETDNEEPDTEETDNEEPGIEETDNEEPGTEETSVEEEPDTEEIDEDIVIE